MKASFAFHMHIQQFFPKELKIYQSILRKYDLPFILLQYLRENSAGYLYSYLNKNYRSVKPSIYNIVKTNNYDNLKFARL